ncbi:hypothetical protein TNCV_2095881 [Trichonephila clavipes]|nr:hypothetical protein TNCV_2095881 [Trichonephila clavipes]
MLLLAVTAKYRSSFGVVTQGATCAVTSNHITIILESLPKPGDTLGDSKFLGYFQLGTSTLQSSNNSTTSMPKLWRWRSVVSPSITLREFLLANSYCHLYGAQGLGQRQPYI